MERIVAVFSNTDDVVLDCFMGSGTTLVACEKLQRSGIGIEVDAVFYEMAVSRLHAVMGN